MRFTAKARAGLGCLLAIAFVAPLLVGQGCPSLSNLTTGGTDTGTGTDTTTGADKTVPAGTVSATAPALNASVTAGTAVTMIYTVARSGAAVSAFYDVDGVKATGDEVVFATGLQTGTDRFVQLKTDGLTAGTIRIGVISEDAGGKIYAYAPGAITIREPLAVTVASPLTDVVLNPGGQCTLRFTANATTTYSYTTFYDQDGAFNGDEITIVTGTGSGTNFVSANWNTSGVGPGTYFVGVKVSEASSGNREGVAYASGRVNVVVGSYLSLISPAVDLTAAPGTPIDITFSAGVPGSTSAVVDVYYDVDQTFSGSEPTVQTGLTLGQTSIVWDTYTAQPATYYVCAVLRLVPGGPASLVTYSSGRVKLEGTTTGGTSQTLVIFTPSVDTTIFRGEKVTINWATGATSVDASLSLYYDLDTDNNNVPDGNPQPIITGLNPSSRQYLWDTLDGSGNAITGRFYILGRLVLKSNGQALPFAKSAGRLTVRNPFFWVGDVDKNKLPGAVLRGFNFQDHAGSGFTNVNDVDGDELNDFLVISQYGKPGLVNPDGLGQGQAYLIYGNRDRLTGVHDLNQTGSKPEQFGNEATSTDGMDQGVIFLGVSTIPGTRVMSGITSVTTAPNMDVTWPTTVNPIGYPQLRSNGRPDVYDDLVFGISKADSLSLMGQPGTQRFMGLLENSGQFLRGGIVIVSSLNDLLWDRSALNRDGNRVIKLQEVGQNFPWDECNPACNSDITCVGEPCLGQAFEDTDTDGKCDAYDYDKWANNGMTFFQPTDFNAVNPPLASPVNLCPVFFLPNWTGMFTNTREMPPFGARILGQALEDGSPPDSRFGTMVSAVRASSGRDFLLISSPNQTAKKSEIPELEADRPNAGVVYELPTCNYGDTEDQNPISAPRPHQYIVRSGGYGIGIVPPVGTAADLIHRPISIVGPATDARISSVTSIPDFNSDGLVDVLVGSPNQAVDGTGKVTTGDQGAVYIIFRQVIEAEGNYLLEKLALDPADPQRLTGVMIRGEPGWRLGESFTGGGDFNGDGIQDVLLGIPNYNSTQGAALVVFGKQNLVSPRGGFTVAQMVLNGDAALLVGVHIGDRAGFNACSVGDFDGDGKDDLAISAPGASPQFMGIDNELHNGLDVNGDGVADDLNNDGAPDDLTSAGVAYIVYGSNALLGALSLNQIGTSDLKGFALVGRAGFDQLGGGMSNIGLGARSKGLAGAGDVDGDGKSDLLIGSMLADPNGKTNGGECYLIYGGFKP